MVTEVIKEPTASMEDYLEAIAMLNEEGKVARVTQISQALGVKKPSVTAALRKLLEVGLVEHERYGYVALTPEGARIAMDVFRRHETLRHFLTQILNVDPEVAAEDACKMEHSVSPATLERLSKFVEFVSTCPGGDPDWLKAFEYFFEYGERGEECLERCQKPSMNP